MASHSSWSIGPRRPQIYLVTKAVLHRSLIVALAWRRSLKRRSGCASGNLTLVEGAVLDVQGRRRRMPIDKRVNSAAEALADVSDGATVFISGFGGAGFANTLIRALRDRGAKNLTLVVNSATHRYS